MMQVKCFWELRETKPEHPHKQFSSHVGDVSKPRKNPQGSLSSVVATSDPLPTMVVAQRIRSARWSWCSAVRGALGSEREYSASEWTLHIFKILIKIKTNNNLHRQTFSLINQL